MSCVKRALSSFLPVVVFLALMPSAARAQITTTGTISPATAPSTWTTTTTAYISGTAVSGFGTLQDESSAFSSGNAYLGYGSTSQGTVTVDGAGATWTVGGSGGTATLYVGYGASSYGVLNITNGGAVTVAGTTSLGPGAGSLAALNFGGGTLTTQTLIGDQACLSGTGTISARGINSDVNIVFNGSATATPTLSAPGIALTLNMGNSTTVGDLGTGYSDGLGSLAIQNGSTVYCGNCTLAGSGGATVDNSTLTVAKTLAVNGSCATLNIQNGSLVTVNGTASTGPVGTIIGLPGDAAHTLNFGPGGGTLTTTCLNAGASNLTGTGTINTKGLVGDMNLTLNSTPSLTQTLTFGNVSVNLNLSNSTLSSNLGAGYSGAGTITINNGITVKSPSAYLGYISTGTGTATVTGSGSTWTTSNDYIGNYGNGTLNITNGGKVTASSSGYIALYTGSSGTVTVDGTGSQWSAPSGINLGGMGLATGGGTGVLNVTNGGSVSGPAYVGFGGTGSLTIASKGTVTSAGTAYVGYVAVPSGLTPTGTATVDGSGSTWNNATLYVGYNGTATMNITNGGYVWETGITYVGYLGNGSGSQGTINFGGTTSGASLKTNSLYLSAITDLTGTGAISTNGLVSDQSLVFDGADPTHSANQTLLFNDGAGGTVTMTLDAHAAVANDNMGVGVSGSATMAIQNNIAVYSANGYLGFTTAGTGTATVTGTGSKWVNSASLYIGNSGTGTLNINTGGSVSDTTGYISWAATAVGNATVDGTGSKWVNSSTLYIGNGGTGTLNVTNGGAVSNTTGYVAYATSTATGSVTVDGSGSTWTSSAALDVAYGIRSIGTVNVTGGASVSNVAATIAYGGTSTGSMTVSGAGSTWTSTGAIVIGNGAGSTGTVNIGNGGTAVAGSVTVASNATSVGTLNFDGGTLKANAANTTWLAIGSGAGTVYIQGGGATFDTNGNNDTITAPLLAGNVTSGGGLTKSGGAGTLTLSGANTYTGNTTVSAGELDMNGSTLLNILNSGAASQFLGAGTLKLNGTLNLNFSGVTETSDSWNLIASSLTKSYGGSFAVDVSGGPAFTDASGVWTYVNSGATWTFTQSSGVLTLATALEPGDANGDGQVDGTDLNIVLSNYGMTSGATWAEGDFNGDGAVDGSDLNIVLSNYGYGSSVTAAVPEPSTLLLAAAGLLGLLGYAWRKNRCVPR